MTPENFTYWLQGFFEIHSAGDSIKESLDINQVRMIKEHLALVFTKVTSEVPKKEIPSLSELIKQVNEVGQGPQQSFDPMKQPNFKPIIYC